MAATLRSIRSMIRSRRYRAQHGITSKPVREPGKPLNFGLARTIMDTGTLPDDATPTKKPPQK